jgi:Skp family chaperone for outer membrane proteins
MKISSHKELQISQEHKNLFKQRAANITRTSKSLHTKSCKYHKNLKKKKGILCGKTIDQEELENFPNANMTWFVLIMGKY